MLRVMLEDADYCDVPADLMTFDDGAVVFWREGEEVGRIARPGSAPWS